MSAELRHSLVAQDQPTAKFVSRGNDHGLGQFVDAICRAACGGNGGPGRKCCPGDDVTETLVAAEPASPVTTTVPPVTTPVTPTAVPIAPPPTVIPALASGTATYWTVFPATYPPPLTVLPAIYPAPSTDLPATYPPPSTDFPATYPPLMTVTPPRRPALLSCSRDGAGDSGRRRRSM